MGTNAGIILSISIIPVIILVIIYYYSISIENTDSIIYERIRFKMGISTSLKKKIASPVPCHAN